MAHDNRSQQKKVAVVHPKITGGGSEAVALWIIETLKDNFDVSLITSNKVDIQQLNKYYGTNLNEEEFEIIEAPMPFWIKKFRKFNALKSRFFQRYCQMMGPKFDLMISAYNPINFGKKSIQFIADFGFDEDIRQNLDLVSKYSKKWHYRDNILRKIYLKFCDFISSVDPKYWKNDLIISNSKWTAEIMENKYGAEERVIYPPVINNFPNIPHEEKEDGFVCIGRMVPEKRIDTIIEILKKVRDRGNDIHLHIAGEIDDSQYCDDIKELCMKHRDWIFLEGKLYEREKKELMAKNLFGISGRSNEPFGISVAEMVKAGCIVFVPNGGGQTEIVDDTNLIYKDTEDAVQKIKKALGNEVLQFELQQKLLPHSQKFSIESFQDELMHVVDNFFEVKYKIYAK